MTKTNWQTIDKAPKNGEELVVTDFRGPPQFATWTKSEHYVEGGFWRNRDGRHRETPTHFLQLPPSVSK
ncbi:hypothetical protein [Duganella vulcania]|uniref:Uncharacterized protein n=1 Tax=Duganella vulcania TaxID=2692166 RepID=A0A845GD36_9BURK|nr:hypothetical protein [Duganella vulcania]MYM92533.1 hypothetical protein [Duganella vulcania]